MKGCFYFVKLKQDNYGNIKKNNSSNIDDDTTTTSTDDDDDNNEIEDDIGDSYQVQLLSYFYYTSNRTI